MSKYINNNKNGSYSITKNDLQKNNERKLSKV